VTFVPDPSDQQLREFIGLASFFSSLSSYEGFGLAAVEAMSAGLLPVLSDIAPFRRLHEFIPDILILAHDQAKAAAQSLEAIMLADDGYAARRQRIMTAAHRYDWTHVARQYAAVYDEGLRRPPHAVTAELESRV
jgi:alpha-1,3-mannosyltransferase